MERKNKLTILSIITSAVILTSSMPVNKTTNTYVSYYYDVLVDDILEDYCYIDENINFIPDDNFVPQGITLYKDYVIISNFDYNKNNNSILCVYDSSGNLINRCSLENKAHVGGIAYDSTNELLWITSYSGCISAYHIQDVLDKSNISAVIKDVDVGKGLKNYITPWINSASFLTVRNNELFVGNFSLRNDGIIKRYSIDKSDSELNLSYKSSFNIPNRVQGISFYEKNNKEYIFFSRSFGRDTPSIIQIFNYDECNTDYREKDLKSISLKLNPMLEQIYCDNGMLYAVYESNSKPYVLKTDKSFDSVAVIDASEVVKKLELKK